MKHNVRYIKFSLGDGHCMEKDARVGYDEKRGLLYHIHVRYTLGTSDEIDNICCKVAEVQNLFFDPNKKTVALRISSLRYRGDAASAEKSLKSLPVSTLYNPVDLLTCHVFEHMHRSFVTNVI